MKKKLCEKWNLCLMRWNMCRRRQCHYVQCGEKTKRNDNKINVHGLELFLRTSSTRYIIPTRLSYVMMSEQREISWKCSVFSHIFLKRWKEMKNEEENGQSVVREWNIYGSGGIWVSYFLSAYNALITSVFTSVRVMDDILSLALDLREWCDDAICQVILLWMNWETFLRDFLTIFLWEQS